MFYSTVFISIRHFKANFSTVISVVYFHLIDKRKTLLQIAAQKTALA